MIRKIIHIDEEKCNGCGLCAEACHEGAIGMMEGKAKLLRDDYCDGLGDCLPACPMDAIHFIEREAAPYDSAAVAANRAAKESSLPCGCPSAAAQILASDSASDGALLPSHLKNWPVQIKLVSPSASYFSSCDLLIAADCTAYAYANLHSEFIRGRVALIGCPKLDNADYAEKLTALFAANDIRSITVLRMEVPCCGGLSSAVQRALAASGRSIPLRIQIISTEGKLL